MKVKDLVSDDKDDSASDKTACENTTARTAQESDRLTRNTNTRLPIVQADGVISLDLSRMGLRQIPCEDLAEIKMVQNLYLEGNYVEELPKNFFSVMQNLKWLDLRNNKLSVLPKSIAYHPNLETLLLQGNQISELPLELGLVPKLKGVQLQGNPLSYPPADVIVKGVQSMLVFLREELEIQSPAVIRPIAEPFYEKKPKDVKSRQYRKLKSMSCPTSDLRRVSSTGSKFFMSEAVPPLTCVGSAKPLMVNSKARPKSHVHLTFEGERDPAEGLERVGLPKEEEWAIREILAAHLPETSPGYEKKMAKREAKLRQKYVREMMMTRLKAMLEDQTKVLQKRMDQNALKQWRQEYEMRKRYPKQNHVELTTPYDTDPNVMFDGTEKRNSVRKAEQLRDVGEEMAEIFIALKNMGESKIEENLSPTTKQRALNSEIKQLAELQKKLEIIKCRNSKEDAIMKVHERNSRPKSLCHLPQPPSK